MAVFESKLYKAVLFLLIIISVGVLGYMILANLSFIDAVYMTVITVTTVGFGEVQPLGDREKIFTIFLILTSITVFGYTVSAFTESLANGQFFKQLKLKKVHATINKLKGHTIVCGFGRNGKQAIVKLKNYQQKFVVTEK